jgi:hypothetical protein
VSKRRNQEQRDADSYGAGRRQADRDADSYGTGRRKADRDAYEAAQAALAAYETVEAHFRTWRRRAVIGFAMLLAAVAVGFWRMQVEIQENERQDATIEAERDARVEITADVIRRTCETDNKQDDLLATLVAVSIADVDPKALSDADLRGLRIFRQSLRELRNTPNCEKRVADFLDPEDA